MPTMSGGAGRCMARRAKFWILYVLVAWQLTSISFVVLARALMARESDPGTATSPDSLFRRIVEPPPELLEGAAWAVALISERVLGEQARSRSMSETASSSSRNGNVAPTSAVPVRVGLAKLQLQNIDSRQLDPLCARAIAAVDDNCPDDQVTSTLAECSEAKSSPNRYRDQRSPLFALILARLVRNEYGLAAEAARACPFPNGKDIRNLAPPLAHWARNQGCFKAGLRGVDALANIRVQHCPTGALQELHHRLFATTCNPVNLSRLSLRCDARFGDDWLRMTTATPESVRHGACAMLMDARIDLDSCGPALFRLGEKLHSEKRNREAVEIFQFISDELPRSRSWGASTFNAGVLWRELGYPKRATGLLERIFPSTLNDLDPSSHLMELATNYRNRSAQEIARGTLDVGDYWGAYRWYYLATTAFPYRSGCGTCRWDADSILSSDRLSTSLKAGPLLLGFELLRFPLSHARMWIMLSVFLVGLGLFKRFATFATNRNPSLHAKSWQARD